MPNGMKGITIVGPTQISIGKCFRFLYCPFNGVELGRVFYAVFDISGVTWDAQELFRKSESQKVSSISVSAASTARKSVVLPTSLISFFS